MKILDEFKFEKFFKIRISKFPFNTPFKTLFYNGNVHKFEDWNIF